MGTKLYKNWWLLLLKGVMTILLGLILLLMPGPTIKLFSLITGIIITMSGLSLISGAFSHRRYNYEWTWWLMEGMVDLVIGILIILNPMEAVNVIVFILALWVLIMGIIQLITAINIQYHLPGNFIFILGGVVAVIFGILLLAAPSSGIKGIVLIFSIFTILYGISQIYISILLRKLVIEQLGEIETQYL